MTPKHIGLDLVLHQATRSENLMQVFNAEKHAMGIKTVNGIDNAIVKYVLTNLSQIDMYMSLILLTQKDSYTTLTNFSIKYFVMCTIYTDVGGIK